MNRFNKVDSQALVSEVLKYRKYLSALVLKYRKLGEILKSCQRGYVSGYTTMVHDQD